MWLEGLVREARDMGRGGKLARGAGSREGGMPKGRGNIGAVAKRSLSSSDSWRRFVFARRFWNHIFTCTHKISLKFLI